MKQKILVTGGAGYIGSITVKELLDNGFDVVVLDSLENGHREAVDRRARLEVVNLSDKKGVNEVFRKHKFDAVIDFAAYLSVGESMENPKKYLDNNVGNFIKLLDVMVENDCRYIIKSSTAATYGNPPSDDYFPLKEESQKEYRLEKSALLSGKWDGADLNGEEFFKKALDYYGNIANGRTELILSDEDIKVLRTPTSIYGLSKLIDEILLSKYNQKSDLKYVALRYFNVSGATLDGLMGEDKPNPITLMTVCYWSLLGKYPPVPIFGTDYPTPDGTGIRDYIHPVDIATGHLKALQYLQKTNQSEVINLGTGKGNTVFEVIKTVEKASGKKVNYKIVPRRRGDPVKSWADPAKAKELLGWEAKYSLDEMAESAWKWHSTHPDGYQIKNG
ncbi:MAG: UDP-glucose 4-epimerase [Patescibacteria group bacterium]